MKEMDKYLYNLSFFSHTGSISVFINIPGLTFQFWVLQKFSYLPNFDFSAKL